ncbi:Gfo/Idh/MocA family protein [Phytomonospora endophytica]|uniref:Putative dehydrogenase n=1 Tax=Phytomonospora endophytica TaxID=714109 RepID=A0A841FDJ8_9ACTN|nr:Gfo/Idh/MocA family oxidoreductase [Phytomonospora endophytica]MBB6034356.1 putative dehydrogenase [Phytomonospora endophytica]
MTPPKSTGRRRYALVGTGSRAEMFTRSIAVDHADSAELVGLADTNPARLAAHHRRLEGLGAPPAALYPAERFARMLDETRADAVVVTTVDSTHDEYILAALAAGLDVVTEKPMTVDAERCRRILAADTGARVRVAFNYRFNPVHERVRTLLADGVIGEIGSVHFEWLLDVRHGADYFRRWHRDKASSGGLLVHKSGHHFDLVNWWLGARPEHVYARGRLFFYGENGSRRGLDRGYVRAHGAPEAAGDPFALRLAESPGLAALYLGAEEHDGYLRDRNVFAPGVSIEDDMSVLVGYDTGATMTYHLTAYSPWEGYRVMFNGSAGRLELEVVENDHVDPVAAGGVKGAALHGAEASAEAGGARLTLHRFWRPPETLDLPDRPRTGHGGADARMAAVLFGGATDPLDRSATSRDGADALLTGLAANASIASGEAVAVAGLLA